MCILTNKQESLKDSVRKLAEKHFAPKAAQIDEYRIFPRENIAILAKNNLFGLNITKEYGGQGKDMLSQIIAIEEVARVCMSTSVLLANQVLAMAPLVIAGNGTQKKTFLTQLATGKILGAFAVTEREAGSDTASIKTLAVRNNGHYIINGAKCFVTNGGEASCYIVAAKTDPYLSYRGLSLFIVEDEREGLILGPAEDTMGIRGEPIREIIFEHCRIPKANLLCEEGQGFVLMMRALDRARIAVAAQAVGIAQGALDYALQYARQRSQFNKPIASIQAVQMMIADMAIGIEAARMLTYQAASLVDKNDPNVTKLASMAKVMASDVAVKVTNEAIQVLGGYGFLRSHPLERMLRDAKVTQLYVGTNQIQKIIIVGQLFR